MADKSILDSPYSTRVPADPTNGKGPGYPFGNIQPRQDDPAWQPPRDPLARPDQVRARAEIIPRPIPVSTIQTKFAVSDVQIGLDNHVIGSFNLSADLIDAIMGDDRVQATLGSRVGGLFGRQVKFTRSDKGDPDLAEECLGAWKEAWSTIAPEPALSQMHRWDIMAGFSMSTLIWDTGGEYWVPRLVPWHLRYSWYLPQFFAYYATTQDGVALVSGGDGLWVLHTPHGAYRGWMQGAVRSVAQPWLIRNFAYRDWARYSERHGMPLIISKEPAAGDPALKEQFAEQLNNLGGEIVLRLPQGTEPQFSFGVELLEASDNSWQAFPGLIDRCDMSIVLAILFQNLTTEVSEGSFAAARVHSDVRQNALAADNRALSHTIYTQIARPFAAINFGDANLAPFTEWDVEPVEDREASTKVFGEFAQAVFSLRRAGYEISDPDEIKELAWSLAGLSLKSLTLKKADPLSGGMGMGGAR